MSVDVKQRPRVLWIGRMQFSNEVRVRETELARHIVEHADLFALDRTDAMPRTPQGFMGKVRMRARLWNAATRVLEEGPITRFQMRVAGATGPFLNRIAAGRVHDVERSATTDGAVNDGVDLGRCGHSVLDQAHGFGDVVAENVVGSETGHVSREDGHLAEAR
jgi:hypothetical protein